MVECDDQFRAVPADRGGDVAAQVGALRDPPVRVPEELHLDTPTIAPLARSSASRAGRLRGGNESMPASPAVTST